MKLAWVLVMTTCALAVACGDDAESAAAGGGGTGGGTTSSGGEGGSSAITPESYSASFCSQLDQQVAVPIDGQADPRVTIELDTLYEMSLEPFNGEGPLSYTGGASLTITEPGRYLTLAVDLSGDTQMSLVTIFGDDLADPTECEGCIAACEPIDSAFVHDLPAGTYGVGASDPANDALSFIVTRVE